MFDSAHQTDTSGKTTNENVPPERARLPPGQQPVALGKWPIIGERKPAPSSAPWTLNVLGFVGNPVEFSLDDLRSLPQTTISIDIHCVTRWSKFDVEFSGVLLSELLRLATPLESAKFISFLARSARNHSTSIPLVADPNPETLIALSVDGRPLEQEHGGPIRNIVPGRYFYKSVKWLDRIELLENDRLGFWESESGYHNEADPWKEQRYLSPTIDKRTAARLLSTKDFSNLDLLSLDASKRDLVSLIAVHSLLRNANFSQSNLTDANFSNANLSNAHFRGANLRNAKFIDADLEGADLSGADLRGADLSGCSLIGASFCATEDEVLIGAVIDKTTLLPDAILAPLIPEQLAFVKRLLKRD